MVRGGWPWWRVLDDEDFLAGPDEAKLSAGDFFDRGRIFAEPARLLGQARVVGALARHRRRQRGVLTAYPQHREQPAIAGERVQHDHQRHENQPDMQQPAVARLAAE